MPTINTQDLTGPALDWAVAKCEGLPLQLDPMGFRKDAPTSSQAGWWVWRDKNPGIVGDGYSPSTDPAQGHPIIDREGIAARKHSSGTWYAMAQADVGDNQSPSWNEFTWRNALRYRDYPHEEYKRRQRFAGPTMLIAAMRCYVASKLGPTVDVPQELLC